MAFISINKGLNVVNDMVSITVVTQYEERVSLPLSARHVIGFQFTQETRWVTWRGLSPGPTTSNTDCKYVARVAPYDGSTAASRPDMAAVYSGV